MNNLSRTFDDAWNRFQALDSLRLVDETLESEWRRGRSEYLAFLVPIEDEAARQHIAGTIDRIAGIPGVQPYRESYWHITIKGAGFRLQRPSKPDEISPEVATAITAAANLALAPESGFTVSLGPVNALDGVVCIEVLGEERIAHLNQVLTAAAPEMPHHPVDRLFLPHISIAHFTSNEGLDQLKSTLADLRMNASRGPTFPVKRIDLILARLSESGPDFELLASYPLRPIT
ncbi:MAG: 2'-5' RNA ligase family protein [Dehalococcoidia bacterium]